MLLCACINAASVVADASKSQSKKPERATKGKKSAQPTEPEVRSLSINGIVLTGT